MVTPPLDVEKHYIVYLHKTYPKFLSIQNSYDEALFFVRKHFKDTYLTPDFKLESKLLQKNEEPREIKESPRAIEESPRAIEEPIFSRRENDKDTKTDVPSFEISEKIEYKGWIYNTTEWKKYGTYYIDTIVERRKDIYPTILSELKERMQQKNKGLKKAGVDHIVIVDLPQLRDRLFSELKDHFKKEN